MDWTQVLTVFAVIATNLGTVIILYVQLDKKIDENRRETNDILKGIQALRYRRKKQERMILC